MGIDMTTNTGGPAFPHVADLVQHSPNGGITTKPITSNGMTLRDYFAAKAMQSYMADENLIEAYSHLGKNVKKEVAVIAYMMADEMLKARGT